MKRKAKVKKRCAWAEGVGDFYLKYHDNEWGVPVHNDNKHFEFLILEGAQAGLSWSTILKKRDGYRKAFADFAPVWLIPMTFCSAEKPTKCSQLVGLTPVTTTR